VARSPRPAAGVAAARSPRQTAAEEEAARIPRPVAAMAEEAGMAHRRPAAAARPTSIPPRNYG